MPVKLVVIGAGIMGRNYLRAAKAVGIAIAGLIDSNRSSAESAATEFGCEILATPENAEAAVIAVPTAAHAAIAVPLLKKGIHCLVEKPFVASEAEGRALIDAAAINNVVLQVGHVERFNPGAEALIACNIAPTSITSLTARRMGPASARVTDISVVSDLMVHDLDMILTLKPMAVTAVTAAGDVHHAEAMLTFADGTTATLTASRTAQTRVRTLDVATTSLNYHLDYIAKSLLTTGGSAQNAAPKSYAGDALAGELADFIGSIENHRRPRVTGEAALAVMQLAWRIEAAL